MSSQQVVKSVSKKLKYYFEVKRLEDGFDLTGPDCPRLDHPPLKARPTLMYDGLHDRPLKHYFSPYDVRVALTQFKPPEGKESQQKQVKKKLEKYMRSYTYLGEKAQEEEETPVLADAYYTYPKRGGKKLRPEAGGGFGVPMRRRKPSSRGGYPVLRSRPPQYISRGETQRLVNMASKMLIATETIDLKDGSKKDNSKTGERDNRDNGSRNNSSSRGKSQQQSAPKPFETDRKLPNVDDNDNKERSRPKSSKNRKANKNTRQRTSVDSELEEDSAYSTPQTHNSPPCMTIDGDQADDDTVPPWLKREMKKVSDEEDSQWVRPHSPSTDPRPPESPPQHRRGRPRAAKYRHRPRPDELPANAQKSAWSSGSNNSSDTDGQYSTRSGSGAEVSTQTGGELLAQFDPMSRVVSDGEKVVYKVHVFTGSCLGASTKADIHLHLCGDRGRTSDTFLSKSKTSKVLFQKGQEDVFEFKHCSVGSVRKIVIGHDRKGMGYGWFLDRVLVKDTKCQVSYDVPCSSWLSSNDGDGSTVKEFPVKSNSPYLHAPEADESSHEHEIDDRDRESSHPPTYVAESQPRPPETQYVNVLSDKSDTDRQSTVGSSHTSLQSLPSGQQDGSRKLSFVEDSVSSSSYTDSDTDSDSDTETETNPPQSNVLSPRSPQPIARRDDFFDQKVKDKDYSSVIESLATEQDNKDDFESDKPMYSSRDRQPTLTLLSQPVDEERSEPGSYSTDTAVLTARDMEEAEKQEEFMDGFKAGLAAAKKTTPREAETKADPLSEPGISVQEAAKLGLLDRVKELAAQNPQLKTSTDEKGWSVLHIAASAGQLEVLQWLSINVIDLDVETPTGYTAMHLAAMHGHANCMMVLAAMGARVGVKSVEKQSPLHLAALGGHLESTKWLVANRCSMDMKDIADRTARDIAQQYGQREVEQFLTSCEEEQNNPHSGFSLMRSSTMSSVGSDKHDKGKEEEEEELWRNDQPSTPRPQEIQVPDESEDELDRFVKKKHDKELMEKRKVYEDQNKKMAARESSFLDAIRAEHDDEFY